MVLFNGDVSFHSSVCLDQPTHHSSVEFRMDTTRNAKHSVYGTSPVSQNTYYPTFDETGDCSANNAERYFEAGYLVWTTTKISNVELN